MLINRYRAAFMIAVFICGFFNLVYSHVKTSPSQAAADNWLPKGFTGHFIQVNGAKIYYRTGGKGPVLVLLHGFPEDGSAFNKLITLASGNYRLIVPDLRGIGKSVAKDGFDAPNIARDVYGILKAEKISHVYLLGHDISGNIAYAFARLYPSMTQGLILAEAPLTGLDPWDEMACNVWHIGFQKSARIPELLIQGRQAAYFREYFFSTGSKPSPKITDNEVSHYAKAYGSPMQLNAGLGLYRALDSDASFNLGRKEKFTVPVFVIGGEYSLGPLTSRIAQSIRNQGATTVSYEILKKAIHYLPNENPNDLYAVIRKHFL